MDGQFLALEFSGEGGTALPYTCVFNDVTFS